MADSKEKLPTPVVQDKQWVVDNQSDKHEAEQVKPQTKSILERLKMTIEEKISLIKFKDALDNLWEVPENERPFYIWLLLYWLNKRGISIEIVWGKLKLTPWKQNIQKDLDIADNWETLSYENLFNNYIKSGDININDVSNALLYKSTWLRSYLFEKKEWQPTSLTEYVVKLLKTYKNLTFKDDKWNPIDASTPEWVQKLKALVIWMKDDKYNEFREAIKTQIVNTDPSDRDFLLAYFDDLRWWWKIFKENSIESYKKNSDSIWTRLLNWLDKLPDNILFSLGLKNSNESEAIKTKIANDPFWFLSEDVMWNQDSMTMWTILAIIWLIFWWAWWALGWFILWVLWVSWFPIIADSIKPTEEGKKENRSTLKWKIHEKFSWLFTSVLAWYDKQKMDNTLESLSKNEKFMSSDASILDIFSTEKDPVKLVELFKTMWIDLNDESKKYYEHIFSKLRKDRKDSIWDYTNWEKIKDYLFRTTKVWTAVTWAAVNTWKSWWEWSKSTEAWTTKPTEVIWDIWIKVDEKFQEFIVLTNEIEKNETWYWWKSKETKSKDSASLNQLYIELVQLLNTYEKSPNFNKDKVVSIKLYMAKYYSWEWINNDHNKDYFKALHLWLQMLPNEWKPHFPDQIQLARRIKWQLWISTYISQEIIKWRDLDEILQDKKISDQIVELKWKMNDEYEKGLKTYLLWLNEGSLSWAQREAKKLLIDVEWFWWFWDFKESNKDIFWNVLWNLWAVWAWIWAWAWAWALMWWWVFSIPWILVWWVVWWATTTLWMMVNNKDDYFTTNSDDYLEWAKEFWINFAMLWVWWWIFKLARTIQWVAPLMSLRWAAALWTEVVWDVWLWVWLDKTRWYFDWVEVNTIEAIQNNLIWALLPLWMFWGKAIKSWFSHERLRLAEDVVREAKWADFLREIWNWTDSRKVFQKMMDKITRARVYDQETNNLLMPLKNHFDDIAKLAEWESKTYWNTIVKREWWNYIFETNWSFSNNIPVDIVEKFIKVDAVNPYLENILRWMKNTQTKDIWWVIVTRVKEWYKVGNDINIYKTPQEVMHHHDLTPDKIIAFWNKELDTTLKAKLSDTKFSMEWRDYFYDRTDWRFRYKDWNIWKEVDPKFVEENFDFLFKQVYKVDYKELWTRLFNKIKWMQLKQLPGNILDKVGWWWELKPWKLWFLYNMTIWELLAAPKVAKQLKDLPWKELVLLKDWKADLARIIFYWDKDRRLGWAVLRGWWMVAPAVMYDFMWWDTNDSEVTDAFLYMYWWVLATAIWTYILDEK